LECNVIFYLVAGPAQPNDILVNVSNEWSDMKPLSLYHNRGGSNRADIKSGLKVLIVLKKDQKTNRLTEGIVKDILTKLSNHHHGIKVRLENGDIGKVREILG
jgi:uncharacterized repeat protein (TIGR03833 family)